MTAAEIELFDSLESSCLKRDLNALNEILFLEAESVEVGCLTKERFSEPEEPYVVVRIKNISTNTISVLEPLWEDSIEPKSSKPEDYSYSVRPNPDARYLKLLQTGESYDFQHRVKLGKYGQFRTHLSFGGWKINNFGDNGFAFERKWQKDSTCDVNWYAKT